MPQRGRWRRNVTERGSSAEPHHRRRSFPETGQFNETPPSSPSTHPSVLKASSYVLSRRPTEGLHDHPSSHFFTLYLLRDMLSPKEAVEKAEEHLRAFYPPKTTEHFRVEAIELPDSGKEWRITFGWAESAYRTISGNVLGTTHPAIERIPRVYKTVRITAETGEFRGLEPVESD